MMRRYSRPRTFTPGWTSPRVPRVRFADGLTTMPSPPAAVSSSHHDTPAATDDESSTSTVSVRERRNRGPLGRRADRRVLVRDQPTRLRAPRQQLGVEQQPVRLQLVEEPAGRRPYVVQEQSVLRGREER